MSNAALATKNQYDTQITANIVDRWRRTYCRGASDDELAVFINTVKRTGLSPEAGQIYAIQRWNSKDNRNVMTIQFSIDGFRVIADRSGKYAGQKTALYSDDGQEWTEAWVKATPPKFAKAGILRSDFAEPLYFVARYDAFVQRGKNGKPTMFWERMPDIMLHKCAEASALRRAFPQELAGCYVEDELPPHDIEVKPKSKPKPKTQETNVKVQEYKPPQAEVVIDGEVQEKEKTSYDAKNQHHEKYLYNLLAHKQVPEDYWYDIHQAMHGKASDQIDDVADVVIRAKAEKQNDDKREEMF